MNKAAHLLDFFFLDEFSGVEIFDLTRNLGVEQGRIKGLNAGNATADLKQSLPGLNGGIADRGQKTYACDYDSAGNKRLSFLDLHAPLFYARASQPGPAKRKSPWPRQASCRAMNCHGPHASPLSDAGGRRGDTAQAATFSCFQYR
jgi:hypothetical protein